MAEVDASTPINGLTLFSAASVDANQAWQHRRPYDWVKPIADWLIAVAVIIICLPILISAWLLVKLTSRGPGIYTQWRVGRHGRPFRIFKLRTMYHNCEAVTGAKWSAKDDPRVTPCGRFLRRSHLDEIPQVLNVILGHMSLVGPRPERPEFVDPLSTVIGGYRRRLAVKPGITGLAQIQLPPDSDLDSVRAKLALDLCYVSRYGASLDARIVLGTGFYLLGLSYPAVRRLVALPGGFSMGPTFSADPIAPNSADLATIQPQALVGA